MWSRTLFLFLIPLSLWADTADEKSLTDRRNFRGDLQLYTYIIDQPGQVNDAYATALGGSLGYKSHLFYRFGMELEYSGSHALGNTKNPERLLLFNNDKPSLHLNTLSQGNLYYQNPTTYFRLGAQTFNTPLFNEDPTRIVPWGATGASITYNRVNELTLIAAAINAIRSNTSAVYRKESASGPIVHGLYFIGGSYYLNDANWLQVYYYLAPNLYDSLYLQYEYRRLLFDTALVCFGIQYIRTYTNGGIDSNADTSSAIGGDDVDLAAYKASMDYAGLDLQLSYSKNRGQSGINNGYGGLSKVYTSSMVANGRKNNRPETWSLKSAYNLLHPYSFGTTELAIWLTKTRYADLPDGDFFSTYAHLRQNFSVNTSAYLRWEKIDYAGKDNTTYVRLILKQQF
ncbi:OprD family outer membrane porin [Sulfurimonas sp. HSL3-7]|uniref:OprD family outer membrane porin n=1 Tax=Sulfonitrofixus jiaomeiensis TaxID=3131938 RepID=UPI0031F85DCD